MRLYAFAPFLLAALLAWCGSPKPAEYFVGTRPAFDPISFRTGHHRSWGVLEDRSGAPTDTVASDCVGTLDPDGALHMVQTLTLGDGTVTHRDWHMRRMQVGAGPPVFVATANDMVGEARGLPQGRVFHWSWVVALSPGNPLKNVVMDQWLCAYANGTMINCTTIRKLGIVLAEVSEQFEAVRGPAG